MRTSCSRINLGTPSTRRAPPSGTVTVTTGLSFRSTSLTPYFSAILEYAHLSNATFSLYTSRPPIDHYREPCDTEVVLGDRFAERPLKLKAPIIIEAMSFGAISKEVKIAIAKGASRIGIPVNTGEGECFRKKGRTPPYL